MKGRHKLFLTLGGKSLFEHVYSTLSIQVKQTLLNFNDLHPELHTVGIPVINDLPNSDFVGPLAGLVSSLEWLEKQQPHIEWLLSIPSDTPFLPSNLLDRLSQTADQSKAIGCYCMYRNRKHFLTGLWHKSALTPIKEYLSGGQRSVKGLLNQIGAEFVAMDSCLEKQHNNKHLLFFNINTPEDLIKAQELFLGNNKG